jgi:Protein of unknown function (DUF3024)
MSLVRHYCEQRVPPQALHQVRSELVLMKGAATIVERRAPWREGFGPEWTSRGVARLRYTIKRGVWTLYWSDRNERWYLYDLIDPRTTYVSFSTRWTVTRPASSGADVLPNAELRRQSPRPDHLNATGQRTFGQVCSVGAADQISSTGDGRRDEVYVEGVELGSDEAELLRQVLEQLGMGSSSQLVYDLANRAVVE